MGKYAVVMLSCDVTAENSAINFDLAFNIFTLHSTELAPKKHITSLPRQSLRSYSRSQIQNRDMKSPPKILKCRNICKLCEVVNSVCMELCPVGMWSWDMKLDTVKQQGKWVAIIFCQLFDVNPLLIDQPNNSKFHK